jgi:hypothetical protein
VVASGSYVFAPSIDDIITDAFERCGVSPSDISSQMWTSSLYSLNGVMVEFTNMQLNLWEVEQCILALTSGVRSYQLPDGTIDVLEGYRRSFDRVLGGTAASSAGGTASNAFDDDLDTACTQTSANGNISYDYGSGNAPVITMVGYMATVAATLTLTYAGSNDGSTWIPIISKRSASYAAKQIVWDVLPTPGAYRYYRVAASGGGTLNCTELYFANNEKDYPLGRMSRQDYDGITNKSTSGVPVAFYVDRAVNPIINIYLTPDTQFTMVKYNRIRQLQTVSGATQTMDSPFRFIEAMTATLAAKLGVKFAPERLVMLKGEATASIALAQTEDRERVKASFLPDLSGYRI